MMKEEAGEEVRALKAELAAMKEGYEQELSFHKKQADGIQK